MAKGSLRRFDVQAKWSVLLSAAGILPCLVMLALLIRNWRSDIAHIVFGNSLFTPLYLACTGSAILCCVFGLVLGYNSAGQRRNEKQKQSWIGFFLGTAGLGAAIVLFAAFYMLRLKVA